MKKMTSRKLTGNLLLQLYQTAIEQFNTKPAKGVQYLQDNGMISTPLNPDELIPFLKENPKLDKKQLGEYLSNKKNPKVLEAFQKWVLPLLKKKETNKGHWF